MDAVRINQIHLCSMICKNTASTCKYKQTYHDIWWYMMIYINSSSVGELTHPGDNQRASRTKNPRREACWTGHFLRFRAFIKLYGYYEFGWYLMIFEYRWCLHISHDVFTCLQTLRYVCQCLYTHAYPCTVNKSMYIHVYPSFVKPLVPLASICILVTSCYIFLHCFILYYSMLIHFCASWFINLHPFMLPGSIAARGDRTRGWLTLGRFWYGPVGFKSFCAHYITLHHITACPQWVYMFLSYPLIWSLHPPWLYPNKCLMFWDLQNAPASFFEGILYTPNRGETSLPFASWLFHIISKNHGKRKAYCRLFLTYFYMNRHQLMNRNNFL